MFEVFDPTRGLHELNIGGYLWLPLASFHAECELWRARHFVGLARNDKLISGGVKLSNIESCVEDESF